MRPFHSRRLAFHATCYCNQALIFLCHLTQLASILRSTASSQPTMDVSEANHPPPLVLPMAMADPVAQLIKVFPVLQQTMAALPHPPLPNGEVCLCAKFPRPTDQGHTHLSSCRAGTVAEHLCCIPHVLHQRQCETHTKGGGKYAGAANGKLTGCDVTRIEPHMESPLDPKKNVRRNQVNCLRYSRVAICAPRELPLYRDAPPLYRVELSGHHHPHDSGGNSSGARRRG